ncbi:MAG: hypothetical protein Q7K43_06640, partial [Candidatus Woesearchaeota archaeon]|nr:hypothetical protein [Candidatus Woesearchaeota archaeon]
MILLTFKEKLTDIYDKKYKELMIVTFVILFLALGVLAYNYATTGEFIQKGVGLKGGLGITVAVDKNWDVNQIQKYILAKFPKADITVRSLTEFGKQKAIVVEASDISQTDLVNALKEQGLDMSSKNYSLEEVGSKLGQQFYRQMITAIIFAFIFMSIVVLFTFRTWAPSFFVILAASADMIITLAILSLMGVKLSMAGIGAFLMLIGYSVDTDILLTARVLKRTEGTILERTLDAMRTGMIMSLTAFGAVFVSYFLTQSEVIKQIMLILSIGLLLDMPNTWIQNAGILRW